MPTINTNSLSKIIAWLAFLLICFLRVSITGFLTAVLQNHARQNTISIDSLNFEFKVKPNPAIDKESQLQDTKLQLRVTELGFQVSFVTA